jgi:hypothetical protein
VQDRIDTVGGTASCGLTVTEICHE